MAKRGKKEAVASKRVAVIGAGIVGVSTAIWLQRAGHQVVLIDRLGIGEGTSFGNGGILAAISIVPVPVPGLWKKVPPMLFSKNGPLFLRWSYLPRLLPFLSKYLSYANDNDVKKISTSLGVLLHDCADQHVALAKGTGAEHFIIQGDYVFGYKDFSAYQDDAYGWELRRQQNYEFEEMDTKRLAEYDPVLAGRFGFAVRCPNHGHITDPGKYVKALAVHAQEQGGEFVQGRRHRHFIRRWSYYRC